MRIKRIAILFSVFMLLSFSIACSFSASTANVKEAYMAHEVDGEAQATTSYTPDEVFYCLVTVANAPDDTITKAVWKAVDAEGIEANFVILESEYEGGGEMTFQASNDISLASRQVRSGTVHRRQAERNRGIHGCRGSGSRQR
jgi:hypothetical protein